MEKYKTEFKLKVVKSFLTGEGGAKLLARHWSVPEEKIRTWVSHYRLHGIDGLRPKRSAYSAQFKLLVLSHQDREQLSSWTCPDSTDGLKVFDLLGIFNQIDWGVAVNSKHGLRRHCVIHRHC